MAAAFGPACPTAQVVDSVSDLPFRGAGSLGLLGPDSGVTPGRKHISGILSHGADYLFIFRVFSKITLIFKKRKKKGCGWKSGKSNLEKI